MVKLLQKDSIKWTSCPGSVELEQSTRKLESTTDNEIRELAKKIVSLKMNYLLNRRITNVEAETRKILEDDNYKEDLEIKLDEVVNVAMDIIDADKIKGNNPIVIVNEEADLSYWVKDTKVNVDIAVITKESLEIITYGFNINNLTLKAKLKEAELMALGVINDYICLYDVNVINYTCVDVESGSLHLDSINVEDLLDRGDEISIAAKKALAGSIEAYCGDYCELCSGKNLCLVNNASNIELLNTETFEPILMEEKDILKVLEQGSKFKKWIDEISKYALDEAVNNNKKWKGFKVVEGRVVRRYKDEEAVKIRLLEAGYEESNLYNKSLLNLSAMEKVVGKNRLSEILGDLIVKPKGKPTLVKEDDKRGKML